MIFFHRYIIIVPLKKITKSKTITWKKSCSFPCKKIRPLLFKFFSFLWLQWNKNVYFFFFCRDFFSPPVRGCETIGTEFKSKFILPTYFVNSQHHQTVLFSSLNYLEKRKLRSQVLIKWDSTGNISKV